MNITKLGYFNVIKELESLKKGWNGYNGKPIKKKILKKFKNMSYVTSVFNKFKFLGFNEFEIDLTPTNDGGIQFEAEKDGIYLEIEIL